MQHCNSISRLPSSGAVYADRTFSPEIFALRPQDQDCGERARLDSDAKIAPASTLDPADPIRQQNPLGKVPVLILDDGAALYDSRVILEYLDYRAGGGKILPADPPPRFAALRLQALADGIMDASILINYEARYRPAEKHEPKWLELRPAR